MVNNMRPVTASAEKQMATRDETLYIAPPVDIFETEGTLTVVADLPGVGKDDVDIRVDDNVLAIKGKSNDSLSAHAIHEEFNLQGYYRQFRLSDEVDQSKISAETKNGVLTITLPKVEKSKPKRIKVNEGLIVLRVSSSLKPWRLP
jgi:HSP20 family protein